MVIRDGVSGGGFIAAQVLKTVSAKPPAIKRARGFANRTNRNNERVVLGTAVGAQLAQRTCPSCIGPPHDGQIEPASDVYKRQI